MVAPLRFAAERLAEYDLHFADKVEETLLTGSLVPQLRRCTSIRCCITGFLFFVPTSGVCPRSRTCSGSSALSLQWIVSSPLEWVEPVSWCVEGAIA